MAFQAKISRARFTVTDFSPREMVSLAESLRSAIFMRLDQALDVYDAPAKPLAERYAKYKQRRTGSGVRDLKLTGETRRAIKVLSAGPNRAVLGPMKGYKNAWRLKAGKSALTYSQLLFLKNRQSPQWGVSPNDERALAAAINRIPSRVQSKVA
jgi:hypothetical protein